jgi:tRNA modification GTPase
VERADLVLWLGQEGEGPEGCWEIEAQCDRADHQSKHQPRHRLSARFGQGVDSLKHDLVEHARSAMPAAGEAALNARQHGLVAEAEAALRGASQEEDPLLVAEQLRLARVAFDRLTGRAGTEDMLDALFGRFCIGK